MTEEAQNLMLEILKRIQADLSDMKNGQRDIKSELISIKSQLHSMQGDALRQERTLAAFQLDLDRIKTRFDLVDA